LVDLPTIVPATANPRDFNDHLLKTDDLTAAEVEKLALAVSDYIDD
jgi:hypothetical protein